MKFCDKCQNMYYISIDSNNAEELIYYCRFCGNKDTQFSESGITVLKTNFKKNEQKFNHMVNKYTKYDPTLPRKTNMKCPNEECAEAHKDSNIIYLRYDDENLKYLYICEKCETTWKTDTNK